MKRIMTAVLALAIAATALAVSTNTLKQAGNLKIEVRDKNPWSNLALKNSPANFQFAIVTDRTGGHRQGVFEAAVTKINLLQPEFVMSVGDLIEGGNKDRARIDAEWTEFNGFIKNLEMPFFYVPGNHDISNNTMVPIWQEQFDRTYFHFVYHDVLFLMLNSEDPPGYKELGPDGKQLQPGHLSEEQLAWAAEVLKQNTEVRWTMVFLHKPMWEHRSNWPAFDALLADRKRTVFAGHEHRYKRTRIGDTFHYTLATTGGGSKLRGAANGEFDHITWITMTPDGPRLANLMLDGIWTEDPLFESIVREQVAAETKAAAEAKAIAAAAAAKKALPKTNAKDEPVPATKP